MRIGIHSFSGGPSLDEQLKVAVDAEEAGFESFWYGHIFGHDALTLAALAAVKTKRIELGTAVAQTYARHPFVTAQQALTTQAAAEGRFTLGIGPSHHVLVQGMWGLPYERVAENVREYLSVLRPLIDQGNVAFSGEQYRVVGALQIPDRKPCSVLISALAPMMLRIAGELADGTLTWMTGPKTIADHIVPRINSAAEEAGRPPPRVCVSLPVAVTDDVAAARDAAAALFEMYGQLPNYRRMLDREGAAGPADVAIAGSEADVERQIRAIADTGATDFVVWTYPVGEDAQASLDRTWSLVKGLVGKV
ncbi:MAG TPA: TIGR03564 family F420-dependent LLM class oxidoreductase [Dehalococcoidia bacterium]